VLGAKGVNWTIGDVELQMKTIANSASGDFNGTPEDKARTIRQFNAMTAYANRYLTPPMPVWVAIKRGPAFDKYTRKFADTCVARFTTGGTFFLPAVVVLL
jgi:hypothetical protein